MLTLEPASTISLDWKELAMVQVVIINVAAPRAQLSWCVVHGCIVFESCIVVNGTTIQKRVAHRCLCSLLPHLDAEIEAYFTDRFCLGFNAA